MEGRNLRQIRKGAGCLTRKREGCSRGVFHAKMGVILRVSDEDLTADVRPLGEQRISISF